MFLESWVFWTWVFFILEWVIRLVMLVYVPQKRSPAAARTWLLLILLEPIIGLYLYLLLGRAFMPRRRIEMQEEVSKLIRTRGRELLDALVTRPKLPSTFQSAVQLAQNLGDFTILDGNSVELLPDYDGAIDRIIADIDAARVHVHLLYYIFADDMTGKRVEEALVRAVGRGVSCRVLMDSFGSKASLYSLGSRLEKAGVEVVSVLPLGIFRRRILLPLVAFRPNAARFDLRNHRKIVVVDGRIGYVGSQNIVDATFKPGIVYEELVARVTGPVVLQLQAVFVADRYFERGDELKDLSHFPKPERTGDTAAQTLPSGPGYPYKNNQRLIVSLIYAAQKRVVITTPYFVPDYSTLQAMTTAALRGVEVHLVTSKKPDQMLVSLAQRSYYEDLLAAGVKIHLYKAHFLHAKHISIDDEVALIGSTNMDLRSFGLLAEITLLVYDKRVVADLHTIQERYFSRSELLSQEEWAERSFLMRWVQNMARLFSEVL